ncbi:MULTISPECIES: DUF5825 family protein [unclassified Streptomyces]|uniref:DUF5825 family protein n=1 Tax=unclassified Streptomyces TaxID=2593676 RepID=UPI00278C4953|nr:MULTISPECIES: DUF5825 family protein [unclassified Streptomyces]
MTAPLPALVPHRVIGTRVRVTEPLPLPLPPPSSAHSHGDGRTTTRAIQFLRECQALGLPTHWEVSAPPIGTPGCTYDLRPLRHLPPPAQHPDESAEFTEWRAAHAYGMLYHRRGPGFVTVMDRRERPAPARFTLDHPDLLAAFDALSEATRLDTLEPAHQQAARHLAEERLALIVDGWAVALPPRVRRWPVPCMGI